jgi:hypothetical protein
MTLLKGKCMRPITAGLVLSMALVAGCNTLPHRRDATPGPVATRTPPPAPEPAALVRYLNENAHKIQGLRAEVAMDCKQDGQSVGVDGNLACSWPRNFRLKAKALGQPAADIGSNDNEFWYWISRAQPPYVYHCSYQDLARGVSTPFPFQPDMVMAALGLAEYDPNKPYRIRESGKFLELIEDTTSPQGKPVEKVTVFNRMEVRPGEPQVVAHVLKDQQGHIIAQAVVHRVVVSRETGAVLPQHVILTWPAQKMEMEMRFRDVQVVRFDAERTAALFQRSSLGNLTSFDLARGAVDGPGIQRAGGFR